MAASQSSSRTGLITALVIFVVLFFVSTILFFVKNADDRAKEAKLKELERKYDKAIKGAEMAEASYSALQAQQEEAGNSGRSVYDILSGQRDALAKAVTGQADVPTAAALAAATNAINDANAKLKNAGVAVPSTSLSDAINKLTQSTLQKHGLYEAAANQVQDTAGELKKQITANEAERKKYEDRIAQITKEAQQKDQEIQTYRAGLQGQMTDVEKVLQQTIERDRKALEELNAKIAKAEADHNDLNNRYQQVLTLLGQFKQRNVQHAQARQIDGKVEQIARNNTCFINLAQGHGIVPGMTFEVYDRNEGIPALNENAPEDQLPVGKASIEVINVTAGTSECRIIKLQPGQQVMAGDVIANLVFDRNTKLNFVVYGDFNVDNLGQPTPQDAEVIKNLITRWGGRVTERVGVETDFLIIGSEPVLPAKPDEGDPVATFGYQQKVKELEAYQAIVQRALDYKVPVLNQNRFLYYVGYYDQAKK